MCVALSGRQAAPRPMEDHAKINRHNPFVR